ncbi:hypothetical protein DOY81_006119, partial [Sarcophaga bullata]
MIFKVLLNCNKKKNYENYYKIIKNNNNLINIITFKKLYKTDEEEE